MAENEIFIKALKNACQKPKSVKSIKDVLNTPEGIQGLKNSYETGMLPDMKSLNDNERMAVLKNLL